MVNIPQKADLVYISFSAEINTSTTESLIAVMAECANRDVQKVYLLLSTGGGTVMDGLNLYHILKGMPFELITHNVGNVDSIGNPVFLAGKTRYACPNATFMFHGVGFNWQSTERLEQKNLEEKLSSLMSDQKRIGKIIVERTSLNTREVKSLFKQAVTKDAEFALSKGVIQDIRDVQITAGCPMFSLVFKR